MDEWFQDELFWAHTYPFMFSEDRMRIGEEQVEKALLLADFNGDKVLDLCCGPGRHAINLAKLGLKVTGVDKSAFLLEKAQENATKADVDVDWIKDDMRSYIRPGYYDLVINIFTSFGYFEEQEEDLQVLKNIYTSLKPGGALVMELLGKEGIAAIFETTTSDQLPDGSTLVRRHEIIDDWTRVRNEWILIKGGAARTFIFDLTLYSGQELKNRLAEAGFDKIKLFGDLDGNPYDINATRLTVLARKKGPDCERNLFA